jgi:hypothetical protein
MLHFHFECGCRTVIPTAPLSSGCGSHHTHVHSIIQLALYVQTRTTVTVRRTRWTRASLREWNALLLLLLLLLPLLLLTRSRRH